MNDTPTPRTDDLDGNLIEFCENHIRFPKMADHARTLETELTAAREELKSVTEQRDRLAEALESIVGESAYEGLPESKQQAIEQALESLTNHKKNYEQRRSTPPSITFLSNRRDTR